MFKKIVQSFNDNYCYKDSTLLYLADEIQSTAISPMIIAQVLESYCVKPKQLKEENFGNLINAMCFLKWTPKEYPMLKNFFDSHESKIKDKSSGADEEILSFLKHNIDSSCWSEFIQYCPHSIKVELDSKDSLFEEESPLVYQMKINLNALKNQYPKFLPTSDCEMMLGVIASNFNNSCRSLGVQRCYIAYIEPSHAAIDFVHDASFKPLVVQEMFLMAAAWCCQQQNLHGIPYDLPNYFKVLTLNQQLKPKIVAKQPKI